MISHEILDEVARLIVENFHPEKIILFGSQARGTADNHSDVDLLVISAIKEKRRKLMVQK
jgi:predicted nucleotidyltransferase